MKRPEKSELQWDEETLIYVDALELKITNLESQLKDREEKLEILCKKIDLQYEKLNSLNYGN